jgi:methylmalonyl-CoA mutase C-terminal domain/subunit
MPRRIRVLVGKPGLDGHDRGAKVVAAALRDAGMEVIYTGLHQTPAQIVEAAIQEDVDVVALSILSGAHMTLFPEVFEQMHDRGLGDRLLTGGGIIPAEDMKALAALGIGQLFGPGASTQDIAAYIHGWFVSEHGPDSAPPLVTPRAAEPAGSESAAGLVPRAAKPAPARTATARATKRPAPKRAAKAAVKRGRTTKRAARAASARRSTTKRSTRRATTRGRRSSRKRA